MTAPSHVALAADSLKRLAHSAGLRPLQLAGKSLVPVVQGGMGIGVSAGGLAGAVAAMGGVGTLSAVDLRRKHPDLMAQTEHLSKEADAKERIKATLNKSPDHSGRG
jgi:nitronate monooxygenase